MLRLTDVIQPKPGEQVEAIFRRHRGALLPPLITATTLIALPFFFLFPLTRQGLMGGVVFAALLASGLTIALRALYAWDANAVIITNQRLIRVRQNGLWNRLVQETSLSAIHELACESRGLWETLFHIGTLRTRASGAVGELVIPKIASPEEARALIERLRPAPFPAASNVSLDALPSVTAESDLRTQVHRLVDKAQSSTLETVKALLEKRVL